VKLIKRILQIAGKKDSCILDFFAGSGTTGQAVLEMNKEDGGNRQFVLITNNEENIANGITQPRLEKVINGYTHSKSKKEISGTGGILKTINAEN
jgi:adenine-specific DNA-methyltransferase